MRKTQVALAALALVASTAAMAGELTLSGQADFGIAHTGLSSTGKGGTFIEQGGLMDHSSINLSGSEDLGNGTKAEFLLVTGFDANGRIDNGGNAAISGSLFNRQSQIVLSNNELGAVGLGKQLSPLILSQALTNFGVGSFWVNRLAVGGTFAASGTDNTADAFFKSNSITYTSPTVYGFKFSGLTTTNGTHGNALESQTSDLNRYNSYSIDGSIGDIYLNFAAESAKNAYKTQTIGAIYKVMDQLSLSANFMSNKVGVSDAVDSWAVGANYSLVAGTNAILQFAQNDKDSKQRLANLTLTHSLSKRTTVYGTVANGKNVGSALGNFAETFTDKTNTSYIVGVGHSF